MRQFFRRRTNKTFPFCFSIIYKFAEFIHPYTLYHTITKDDDFLDFFFLVYRLFYCINVWILSWNFVRIYRQILFFRVVYKLWLRMLLRELMMWVKPSFRIRRSLLYNYVLSIEYYPVKLSQFIMYVVLWFYKSKASVCTSFST